MPDLMDIIKPQMDAMNEMWRVGYQAGLLEGRRQAMADVLKDLNAITKTKETTNA